jgi:large subunit ribosomal protein L30
MTRLEIRQERSAIGEKKAAKQNLTALGLGRTGQVVMHEDTPALRGMLRKVAHLVVVTEANGASPKKKESA